MTTMRRAIWTVILAAAGGAAFAQSLPIIPKPYESTRARNARDLIITPQTRLISKGANNVEGPDVRAFNDMLAEEAGFRLKVVHQNKLTGSEKNAIVFEWHDLADWSYYGLKIRPDRVLVQTNGDEGGFWSVQTMRQLISGVKRGREVRMTSCDVYDKPRFSWRGMHLDVSRHFFDGKFVRQYLDWLAEHKMNKFHWHLVDDGGWRMESKAYPKLTSVGAWRAGDGKGWAQNKLQFLNPVPKTGVYGGFYAQPEIKSIVKYAADRHIDIVPEIEMPGHCMPVLAAYPELGCRIADPAVNNVLCPGNPKALTYAKRILDETMTLFPSKYIHIGADEVDRSNWKRCPDCQALMHKEGLEDDAELQSWFVRQMDEYIRSKGRILVGWDEILDGGLAPGATVMSWRGSQGGIDAAKQGRDVVMSPNTHCYFDYSYAQVSTEHVYTFNPVPGELNREEARKVLGGQANVWTEWIETPQRVEQMIFPRIASLAESLWSPPEKKNWSDFRSRLLPYIKRLEKQGIDHYPLTPNFTDRALIFESAAKIEVPAEKDSPWPLRYTTDGTVPTLKSPVYKQGIPVRSSAALKFAYVNSKGLAGNTITISASLYKPLASLNSSPGLKRRVLAVPGLKDFVTESQWSQAAGASKEVADLKLPTEVTDNYGCRFDAWIEIKKEGTYRFELGSDDGSRLFIGGATVVDNGGLHGFLTKEGAVTLKKGFYPIRIEFFEADGAERLTLRWCPPGQGRTGGSPDPMSEIPAGVLRVRE